jgi:hypothetical protein
VRSALTVLCVSNGAAHSPGAKLFYSLCRLVYMRIFPDARSLTESRLYSVLLYMGGDFREEWEEWREQMLRLRGNKTSASPESIRE